MKVSDSDFCAELVGTCRAILKDARAWAVERPGVPAGASLTAEEDYELARRDCGEHFRGCCAQLAQALVGRDAEAVVHALIGLGHAGRDVEILPRFVAAAKLGRKSIPTAGGKGRGKQIAKVPPEETREMQSYYESVRERDPRSAISLTMKKFKRPRTTVTRHVKKNKRK